MLGQLPKQRLNSVRAQDIFNQEASSPSSPSVNVTAFDYGASRSVQRSHSSSGSSSVSTQSSKHRHRSKSHGDDSGKKQVSSKNFHPIVIMYIEMLFTHALPKSHCLIHELSLPQIIIHPRACNLWNVLPHSCFPESYNLPSFKSKINKLDLISLSSQSFAFFFLPLFRLCIGHHGLSST